MIHTPKSSSSPSRSYEPSKVRRRLLLQWMNELLLKFWFAADLEVIPLLRGGQERVCKLQQAILIKEPAYTR